MMLFMALHVDGTEWPYRAEVLAGSATNTAILINCRNARRLLILWVHLHHGNGSYRAMTGTVTTRHAIGNRQAVLLNPYGMTDLF